MKRKFVFGIMTVILIGGGYFGFKTLRGNTAETRYVLAAVEKGTLITSVSGTGQVFVSDQVDVKPKTSGDIIYVGVKNGQKVKAGALIAEIDPADAQKAVQDAQTNLDQANLALSKMNGLQTNQGDLRGVKEKASDDLAKAYEDGFNDVANTFLDLPTLVTGLNDMFFNNTIDKNLDNITWYLNQASLVDDNRVKAISYRDDVYNSYNKARDSYTNNFDSYKAASRTSGEQAIEALISQTYETTRVIADAVKTANNYIDLAKDSMGQKNISIQATMSTHQSTLNSYTGTTNSHLSTLLSAENTIQTNKENLIEAGFTIADQEIQVKKMQDALGVAKEGLGYCYVYAPFDGVVAKINVQKGDSVSSGTAIATFITQKSIATISLNEVDAAKVKVGQKVNLTFDAVEGLTMTGVVGDVDTVGTVSQGVVSYNTTISFDTQDDRVKPGMSVSASIITDVKQDALLIPNSAVKSSNGTYYVEMLGNIPTNQVSGNAASSAGIASATPPEQQAVGIGLSNDSMTEVVSGLKEGDEVITRTISQSTTGSQQAQGQSLFQTSGADRGSNASSGLRAIGR